MDPKNVDAFQIPGSPWTRPFLGSMLNFRDAPPIKPNIAPNFSESSLPITIFQRLSLDFQTPPEKVFGPQKYIAKHLLRRYLDV